MTNVLPGTHRIRVVGRIEGADMRAERAVTVAPGAVSDVKLTLS